MPSVAYELLDSRLKELSSYAASHLTIELVFSTLVMFYTGTRGIKYLIVLANLAHHGTSSRSFLRRTMLAVALTFAAILVLITALSALAASPILAAHLPFPRMLESVVLLAWWPMLAGVVF